jgi:hypothetical protein
VRVNAVLPGWLDTEWVSCGFKGSVGRVLLMRA